MRERRIYLCVTARPMSLLTACGELRCTAILSSQGERDDGKKGSKIRGRIGLCRERLVSHDGDYSG